MITLQSVCQTVRLFLRNGDQIKMRDRFSVSYITPGGLRYAQVEMQHMEVAEENGKVKRIILAVYEV